MTPEQQEFEKKYHYKLVKPLGNDYQLPIKEYIIICSLLNWEDNGDTTILALKALDYTLENKHMFVLKIAAKDLEKCLADFEIIRDGYEEFVKPVIISESLISHIDEEGEDWLVYFSDYYKNGKFLEGPPKTEYLRIPKKEDRPGARKGLDEYMIVYKSISDLGKPSTYVFEIPSILQYTKDIFEYVAPFRQAVLDNQVVYGINRRLISK